MGGLEKDLCEQVAVPSRSGRNDAAASQFPCEHHLAVPSRSGRNVSEGTGSLPGNQASPSPQGRVGTSTFTPSVNAEMGVAVPSRSGRD